MGERPEDPWSAIFAGLVLSIVGGVLLALALLAGS